MRLNQLPLCLAMTAVALLAAVRVHAQIPSFPGAEGYGATFTGSAPAGGWFSNATVYHVTTTQDLLDSGTGKPAVGTLRGAFYDYTNPNSPKQLVSNRIVVFDVGGTFQLTQGSLDIKTVNNIYIAGQTAPSPAVVYGHTTQITKSNNTMTSNVVLRYMTFRKGTGDGADAITFAGGDGAGDTVATNMIVDHVSATWSEDEVLSVTNNNTHVSVQYSMMTDSLTSGHEYGSLMRPKVDAQVTFHHNLYGNDKSRNPRMGSYNNATLTLDFVDNVIYNWSLRAGYAGGGSDSGPPTEKVNVNWVGNYAIAGPATPAGSASTTAVTKDIGGNNPLEFKAYQALNRVDSNHNAIRDGVNTGWDMFQVSTGAALPEADKAATPFVTPAVTTTDAADAYNQVIAYVGNSWWHRDAIDARIIGNVQNNTQPAGGVPATAPVPAELALVTAGAWPAAPSTRPAGYDTDNDGMPNDWETAHGLNPASAADNVLDFDNDGYVNVVEYLNEAGEFPAPAPIVFNGATNMRYAQITNWKTNDGGVTAGTNWQPSKYDTAVVHNTNVTVDAVGQHAGTLQLAPAAGDVAFLNVTAGWLDVAQNLSVGAAGTGVVYHTGGLVVASTITLGGAAGASGIYNLGGTGQLTVGTLSKGASGGQFNMSGGTLSADTVNFSLTNNGGTISPGASPGSTHVVGNLSNASGKIKMELAGAGAGQYDEIIVDGALNAGGILEVTLLGSYAPAAGATFDLFDFTSTGGSFGVMLPNLAAGLQWNTSSLYTTGELKVQNIVANNADFNNDGYVDAQDYLIWQRGLGLQGQNDKSTGDANGDHKVDALDLAAWQSQLGPVATPAGAPVPEPTAAALVLLALTLAFPRLRSHSR